MGRPPTESDMESRRILDRVAREADAGGASMIGKTRAHLAADNADQDDWIDVLGTRLGRWIALVGTCVIIVWLLVFLLRGS